MLKTTFQTIQQITLKTVVLRLTAQARQKVEMEVVLSKKFVNRLLHQLSHLSLLAQVLLMKKLKVVRQIIPAAKSTLKRLVCVLMEQLKQVVGNCIRILALQIHHHVK
jgi:hypothetical protein